MKLKVNPTEKFEHRINELLSKKDFPRYKYQLSSQAKCTKHINGEEKVSLKWVKSDFNYIHSCEDHIFHNNLIQKLDDEQLEGPGCVFKEIEETV